MPGRRLPAALCQKMLEGTKNDPAAATGLYSWGTLPLFGRFAKGQMYLPVKNYTTNVYPIDPASLERYSPGSFRSSFAARPTGGKGGSTGPCLRLGGSASLGPPRGSLGLWFAAVRPP